MARQDDKETGRTMQITLRQLVLLGIMAFSGMGAMFVLGVLVGRGMSPLDFREEIVSIHQEIAGLRKTVANGHTDHKQAAETEDFDIYEYLKKDDNDLLFDPKAKDPTQDLLAMALAAENTKTTAQADPKDITGTQGAEPPKNVSAGWSIQVASVTIEKDALRYREKYRQMGYPVYITFLKRPNKPVYFRIRVGPYPVKEDAAKVHAELQKKSRDCYMLYEDGEAPIVMPAGQEDIPKPEPAPPPKEAAAAPPEASPPPLPALPDEAEGITIKDLGPQPEADDAPGAVETLPEPTQEGPEAPPKENP
ncbi:MAG: SPOR domain-containing protein [Thermodesulfobacteriota bacterium]